MLIKNSNSNSNVARIKFVYDNPFDAVQINIFLNNKNHISNNRDLRDRFKNSQKKQKTKFELNDNANIKKSKHRMNKFLFMKINLKNVKIANKIAIKKSVQNLKNTKNYKNVFENEKKI